MDEKLWGIDLGGTKIEAVALDRESGRVLARHRLATEAEGGYEHILERIRHLVEECSRLCGSRPSRIGMGTPGTTEPATGLIKNSNTACLNGRALEHDCAKLLSVPVTTANDANCFALAETLRGAVKEALPGGAACVFGVILGTGVGGGAVIGTKILRGLHGIGGEWGHNFLDSAGGPCYCGRSGCVETLISGPALEKFYHDRSGTNLRLPEIIARTATDPHAAATQERLIKLFGRAIAAVINILDPDALVLGGGVGNIDALYSQKTRDSILANVFNPELKTLVLRPKLGDSAGVFGAAELVR